MQVGKHPRYSSMGKKKNTFPSFPVTSTSARFTPRCWANPPTCCLLPPALAGWEGMDMPGEVWAHSCWRHVWVGAYMCMHTCDVHVWDMGLPTWLASTPVSTALCGAQGAEAEGGGSPASPVLADSQATLSPGQSSLLGVTSSPSPCCGIKHRDKAFQPQSPMMRKRREGWSSTRRGAHHPGPLCHVCITE